MGPSSSTLSNISLKTRMDMLPCGSQIKDGGCEVDIRKSRHRTKLKRSIALDVLWRTISGSQVVSQASISQLQLGYEAKLSS
eukprot:scaffold7539_cov19-Tisochrysis_lutea.AAC.2